MEFTLIAGSQMYPSSMSNIYDLKHIGIQNMQRMQLFVAGRTDQLGDIARRVYQLSLVTIRYHGQTEISPSLHKFQFSFSGRACDLQKIRDALEIVGKDDEEAIEEVGDEVALPIALFSGLSLDAKEKKA